MTVRRSRVFTLSGRSLFAFAACLLALAGCGDSESSDDTASSTEAPTTAAPVTEPEATDAPTTTVAALPAALQITDTGYAIDWTALETKPFFALAAHLDPFFHIHTDPDLDGFFISFELYTTYGPTWTGELGTFEISCSAASTGICVHFDPDGDGPIGNLGADFRAAGTVTINALDETTYDIVVDELVFSDGTTVTGLHMVGTA